RQAVLSRTYAKPVETNSTWPQPLDDVVVLGEGRQLEFPQERLLRLVGLGDQVVGFPAGVLEAIEAASGQGLDGLLGADVLEAFVEGAFEQEREHAQGHVRADLGVGMVPDRA